MEQLGKDPNTIYATVHVTSNKQSSSKITATNACGSFHSYQLTWTADSLSIGIDGKIYETYTNSHIGTAQWPFDAPQYVLLNLALGGSWAGPVNDAALPESMVVDYVRVYQKG